MSRHPLLLLLPLGLAVGGAQAAPGTLAAARPGTSWDDPIRAPRDLTGRSVKTPRVRARHTTDVSLAGGTAYLLQRDPWLAYQRGRELLLREFSAAEGVFGEAGKQAGPRLEDGATHMMGGGHAASCAMCHNTPWRDMGSGAVIAKNGGRGRDTPHLFGAGLLEMLGWQNRLKLLEAVDRDRSGWISPDEAAGNEAQLLPAPPEPGAAMAPRQVSLGRFDDIDGDGRPDLDPVLAIYYVDAAGKRIAWARSLKDAGVAGYAFEHQVFGFGHHRKQTLHGPPLPSTLRAFTGTALDVHAGLQAFDPTVQEDPDEDGLSGVSLAGAQQFTAAAFRDRGATRDARGVSLDDPDRDGVPEEISEGDLDLAEHFLLNHPRPAERLVSAASRLGRGVFHQVGCARCHVPDWQLEAAPARPPRDPHRAYPGDRRFFDLEVEADPETGALRGRVVLLPAAGRPFRVRGLYSDLATHDLGPGFREVQFDGSVITRHRTTPLWGVGSTGPYGHDGASLDLDAVIRRHGGEAAAEATAYAALPRHRREALQAFLRGLVLYGIEDLPADIDGDGRIAEHFMVQGQDTGGERLNPEWLFRVPGRIEGEVQAPDGSSVRSLALTNLSEAYGLDLEWLQDRDGDGFPDRAAGTRGNATE